MQRNDFKKIVVSITTTNIIHHKYEKQNHFDSAQAGPTNWLHPEALRPEIQ